MAFPAPTNLGRRLHLAAAGAVVVAALTVAPAAASAPTPMGAPAPMEVHAPAMTRLGASSSHDPSASSPAPGFLLERGRFTAINRPGATLTALFGINDRGQIVGAAGNPEDQPSPEPTDTPMGRMA